MYIKTRNILFVSRCTSLCFRENTSVVLTWTRYLFISAICRLLWSVWEDCCCVWWDRYILVYYMSLIYQIQKHVTKWNTWICLCAGNKLAFTCLQVNKVEKFKRSQAKEDALHAKYNLSEWLQVLIFYYKMEHTKFMCISQFHCIFIFSLSTTGANISLSLTWFLMFN